MLLHALTRGPKVHLQLLTALVRQQLVADMADNLSMTEPAAPEAVQPPQVAKYCMPLSKPCARVGDITTAPMGKPLPIGFPSVTCMEFEGVLSIHQASDTQGDN
jgi:hypothetical protein